MFSERGIGRFEKANAETVMSKDFLTLKDAATRLGTSSDNMNFITKNEAIISGADPSLLSDYNLRDFPAEEDIKGSRLLLRYDGATNTFTQGGVNVKHTGSIAPNESWTTFGPYSGYCMEKITTDNVSKTWHTFKLSISGYLPTLSQLQTNITYPLCGVMASYNGTPAYVHRINIIQNTDLSWKAYYIVATSSNDATTVFKHDLYSATSRAFEFVIVVEITDDGLLHYNSMYDNTAITTETPVNISNLQNTQVTIGNYEGIYNGLLMGVKEFKIETFDK